MITTVTLNPCIDRTITVEEFLYGGTNKVTAVRSDVSGKGINTSTVLRNLGAETICLGFNYRQGSAQAEASLKKQGIPCDLVDVDGELRTNVKIFDSVHRVMSEFNESGHPVTEKDVERLLEKVDTYLEKTRILVLDGSVPKGVPDTIYRTMIERAGQRGVRTILDASNALLTEGIKGKPYLIKPNIDEFSILMNRKLKTREEILQAAGEIIREGIPYVCISMGAEGAFMVSREEACFAPALKLEVKGIQGAGDSLVAGICMAMEEGRDMETMLRYAMAAAGGSLLREGTQLCTREDFERLLGEVVIERV